MPDTSPSHSLDVRFNGTQLRVPRGTTLATLLDQQDTAQTGVATAINGDFITRDLRARTILQAHDEVLTFQAIVGG